MHELATGDSSQQDLALLVYRQGDFQNEIFHVLLLHSRNELLFSMCIIDFSVVIVMEATYNTDDFYVLDSSFV